MEGVFTSGAFSSTLTDTTALQSAVVPYLPSFADGTAVLVVGGSNNSGSLTGLTIKYRLEFKMGDSNTYYSDWYTLSNTFTAANYANTGSTWTMDTVDLAADSNWKMASGIQFEFTGAGIHSTNLYAGVHIK